MGLCVCFCCLYNLSCNSVIITKMTRLYIHRAAWSTRIALPAVNTLLLLDTTRSVITATHRCHQQRFTAYVPRYGIRARAAAFTSTPSPTSGPSLSTRTTGTNCSSYSTSRNNSGVASTSHRKTAMSFSHTRRIITVLTSLMLSENRSILGNGLKYERHFHTQNASGVNWETSTPHANGWEEKLRISIRPSTKPRPIERMTHGHDGPSHRRSRNGMAIRKIKPLIKINREISHS